jgi:hypothetical protein
MSLTVQSVTSEGVPALLQRFRKIAAAYFENVTKYKNALYKIWKVSLG